MKGLVGSADGLSRPYVAVRVAYPWLIALPAMIVLASLRAGFRSWRRIARGCCVRCGYDLRASSERCPECGTAMPAKNAQIHSDGLIPCAGSPPPP